MEAHPESSVFSYRCCTGIRGRRGMKRNASGPLEVAEMDVDVSPHVFTLSFARADSLKSHGKKTTDGVKQKDFHCIGMAFAAEAKSQQYISLLTEAAWCKRNVTVENSRDRIQTCRQGLWWVLVQSHAKFKVAQSGRFFLCKTAAVRALAVGLLITRMQDKDNKY